MNTPRAARETIAEVLHQWRYGDNGTSDTLREEAECATFLLTALSEAGYVLCREQVGWRDEAGYLWSDRRPVDDPCPVYVPVRNLDSPTPNPT